MAYHASSYAFDKMLDAHLEQLCTGPDDYEGQYNEIFEAIAEQIDADVLAEEQDCSFADPDFARMPFLSSNPPTAADLVSIFEQNTWLTINAAAGAVKGVLQNGSQSGGCMDPATLMVDTSLSATILADLEALPIRLIGNSLIAGDVYADPQAVHLSLGTVYHKLMMLCAASDEDPIAVNYTGVCQRGNGSLFQLVAEDVATDSNPVFDIVTAADINLCAGVACRDAARAVLAYQELLGSLTVLRWDVIRMASGSTATTPLYEQRSWVYQRGCPALRAIVDNIDSISSALPVVVEGLRKFSPQLEASCVSPRRDKLSRGRATVALGYDRAKNNSDLWAKTGVDLCTDLMTS